LDFIHVEELHVGDDFPIKIARTYVSLLEEQGRLPDSDLFLREAEKVRTTFFKMNARLSKRPFLNALLKTLNIEIAPLLKKFEAQRRLEAPADGRALYERIYVDDIDSFNRVKRVKPKSVFDSVPLGISEAEIKERLADIVGERFVPKDWPGEKSDLYSSFVKLKGGRLSTAFMLKGPSVKKLTIDKCGVRGNQLQRLVREPARLYIVQHIGEIDTDVIELLETLVSNRSQQRMEDLFYCIIDGVDTARVLKAYGKL
jgi:hypothetical protein